MRNAIISIHEFIGGIDVVRGTYNPHKVRTYRALSPELES